MKEPSILLNKLAILGNIMTEVYQRNTKKHIGTIYKHNHSKMQILKKFAYKWHPG